MSVTFVYRSHYEGPTGKFVQRFPDDASLLAWFQNRWQGALEAADPRAYGKSLLGCSVYGFASLFEAIAANSLPVPKSVRELSDIMDEHLYAEGEIQVRTHVIQVLTDDDELEMAYYFFDDTFLAQNGGRAAYLMHEEWELPTEAGSAGSPPSRKKTALLHPRGKGEGRTYLAFLSYYDSGNLSDIESAYRIEGVRLPDLPAYLTATPPTKDWPLELSVLKACLASEETLEAALITAGRTPIVSLADRLYSILSKDGEAAAERALNEAVSQAGDRDTLSRVQAAGHMAQLSLHTETWGKKDLFHRWILFDDLWLAANHDLGESILRYASRWDVLT